MKQETRKQAGTFTVKEAEQGLRDVLKEGYTVYCILRSRSKSGMSRRIDFVTFDGKTGPYYLTSNIAKLLGYSYSMDDWSASKGMRVNGCGMDMGFHVVSSLSHKLFGDDYKLVSRWL